MENVVSWFEIPATDLERAVAFYRTILGRDLASTARAEQRRFAMFPAGNGVNGALVQGVGYVPSVESALLFLNAGDTLQPVVDRVEASDGQVVMPRMDMGPYGVAAFIIDSEGNKVALHAMS